MKKLFLFLTCIFISISTVSVYAEDNTCGDNLTWSLTDGVLTISGEGDMYDYSSNSMPWNSSKSSITEIVIEDGVTSIGQSAFYECTSLKKLTIGKGVTFISEYAFYKTNLLDTIDWNALNVDDFGSQNNIFSYAGSGTTTGITLTFGDDVEKIPAYAFNPYNSASRAPNLADVKVSDTVTTIGDYAFYYCDKMKILNMGSNVAIIGEYAFYNCKSMGITNWSSNLEAVGSHAFYNCASLTSIILSDNVASIGEYAFYGCSAVKELTIGKSVSFIPHHTFYNMYLLEKINWNATEIENVEIQNNIFSNAGKNGGGISLIFGDEVKRIPDYAFNPYGGSYAPKLNDITIPDSVEYIGAYAFYHCANTKSLSIGNGVTEIGEYAFYNCKSMEITNWSNALETVGNHAFYDCASMTSIILSDNVTSIGEYAFCGCKAAKELTIGKNIFFIPKQAFNNTLALEKINWNATDVGDFENQNNIFSNAGKSGSGIILTFGDEVKRIPNYAFNPYNNSSTAPNFDTVIIPDSVEYIGAYAFYHCANTKSLSMGNSVTEIGEYAFYNCKNMEITSWSNTLEAVGNHAFYDCASMTSIILYDSVTSVGEYAFSGCKAAKELTIGKNIYVIPKQAFNNTLALEKINWNATWVDDFENQNSIFSNAGKNGNGISLIFGDEVIKIPAYAFNPYGGSYAPKLNDITVPDSVEYIGAYAFYQCANTKLLDMGNSVKEIGEYAFYNCNSMEITNWSSTLEIIGNRAFYDCASMTCIILSDSVTSIGEYAFSGCKAAKELTIGKNISYIPKHAFNNTLALEKINWNAIEVENFENQNSIFSSAGKNGSGITLTFGDEVTRIPDYAFNPYGGSYAPNFDTVIIPDSVSEIGNYAFYLCSSMKNLTIGSNLESIGNYAFYGCSSLKEISIPNNTYVIGEYAFTSCENVEALKLGNGVFELGKCAFANLCALKTLTVPGTVTEMGAYAFQGCYSLETLILEDGLTSIGENAFSSCSALNSITIPKTLSYIGAGAFEYCTEEKDVFISDIEAWCNITNEDENSYVLNYGGYLYIDEVPVTNITLPEGISKVNEYMFKNCYNVASVELSNSVEEISQNAFNNCAVLEKITFGNGLKTIGSNAFSGCEFLNKIEIPDIELWCNLTFEDTYYTNPLSFGADLYINGEIVKDLVIPYTVEAIKDYTFSNGKFESVTISDGVKSIGSYAFSDCLSLTDITIGKDVTSIAEYAFYNTPCIEKINWNAKNVNDLRKDNYVFYNTGTETSGVTVSFGGQTEKIPAYIFSPYYSKIGRASCRERVFV